MSGTDVDDAVAEAWSDSWLTRLPADLQQELRSTAIPISVKAGQLVYRAYDPSRLVLVVEGLSRIFASSAGGRHVTLRYVRPGDCVGAVSVVMDRQSVNASAVTDCELLFLNAELVRHRAQRDAKVGWVLTEAVSAVLTNIIEVSASNVFGSIRERVARHLLDLAVREGDEILVHHDLQNMADAIGSVREVVGRAVRDLAAEGLITRRDRDLVLEDTSALHAIATDES